MDMNRRSPEFDDSFNRSMIADFILRQEPDGEGEEEEEDDEEDDETEDDQSEVNGNGYSE